MDASDGIPRGTILEFVVQGGIEFLVVAISRLIQYQVERSSSGTRIPSPVLEGVAAKTPKFWSTRGDLKPVVTNEQEVVGSFLQPAKVTLGDDIPTENFAKDFGWELGNVQQRVSRTFEFDNLFVQSPY